MLPYSYLVLSVFPSTNESNVDIQEKPLVHFAKPMKVDTLNANTIRFQKVNGDFVEYKGEYNYLDKSYKMEPLTPLEVNTQYQIIIMGEKEGVSSIDDSYLPQTKTYQFVTVEQPLVKQLHNLVLTQDHSFIHASWELPDDLTISESILFSVKLSTSINPNAEDLWPQNALEGRTNNTSISIPYKVEPNTRYFVHVQGIASQEKTVWLTNQLFIEPDQVNVPVGTTEPIRIIGVYPEKGSIITPTEIIVGFNDVIHEDIIDFTIEQNPLFYVVEAPIKSSLTPVDVAGLYSVTKAILGTVHIDPLDPRILIWVPKDPVTAFKKGKEYSIVISKNINGINTSALGYTFTSGFIGQPEHFHGDLNKIKELVSAYGTSPSDSLLHSLMKKYSLYACDIWFSSPTFDETLHTNGEAPYFIHEYVNTQVAIDILLNSTSSSLTGSETIKLSDFSVSKETSNSSNITSIIQEMKSQVKMWEDLLHGYRNRGYAKPGSTVKGQSVSAYPESLTRSTLKDFDS